MLPTPASERLRSHPTFIKELPRTRKGNFSQKVPKGKQIATLNQAPRLPCPALQELVI